MNTVTVSELNSNITELHKKVDKIETNVTKNFSTAKAHPVMFIILLIGFFITMDFWATAAHTTIHRFHPRGHLLWWEDIIIAIIALGILLWLGDRYGIRINMLGLN